MNNKEAVKSAVELYIPPINQLVSDSCRRCSWRDLQGLQSNNYSEATPDMWMSET